MLKHGDCITELNKIEQNSIDLIYLDPPFFTQKKQTLKNKDNSKEYSFEDTWDSIHIYKNYIQKRLNECKRVLKNTGSIFLHCDRSASHHLRIALDEVFGDQNFRSEIIWSYKRWSNAKKGLLNAHQVIFFYTKTKDFKFNQVYTDYSPTTNLDQIFQKRVRDKNGKTVYKTSADGNVELIEEKKGVPLSDVWEIPYLNPKAKERVGYPTQKPILLLEKIIKLVTNEGDTVLDPFCGSGTTLVASKLLKRKYIGIDQSEEAIKLASQRLDNPIKTESNLLKNGKDSYINQDLKTLAILNRLHIIPVQRNKGIDGFLKTEKSFKPIPVRIQKESETLENAIKLLLQACQKNGYQKKILIKTNNLQMNQLFDFDDKRLDKNVIVVDNIDKFCEDKERFFAI
ncbi:MAG: site-specific DNA-methyltransferase [Candidatus Delongbacteria bacterium]|jgi:site-specific DNA-methyltransferase (adenine-specific)|nr:site-specific DNA-methyltransferase [Candidatus Delongbacteria bacterium]